MIDETVVPETPAAPEIEAVSYKSWRSRVNGSKKRKREDHLPQWEKNIDYRRGKVFDSTSDSHRIVVNKDWPLTKAKHATLFSQVPVVTTSSTFKAMQPVAYLFGQAINKRLDKAKVAVAMDEVMPDVINAAGIGAVQVSYQARTVTKALPLTVDPSMPPEDVQGGIAAGQIQTTDVPLVTSSRFCVDRISPGDLLWPEEFTGSDFDKAPWLGRTGRLTWAEAQAEFGLADHQKEDINNGAARDTEDRLNPRDTKYDCDKDGVTYDEVFYWRYKYDAEEPNYETIWRMVLIDGIDKPVVHEAWKGQAQSPEGKLRGAHKLPIRVCTLTYMSDEAIPPSDSAMGRPQVDELIESRSMLIQQQRSNRPLRTVDINRVDPQILDKVLKGTVGDIIPVIGDGERVFSEVAKASVPRENYDLNGIANNDLLETWRISQAAMGQYATGERSAEEANNVQEGFATGAGYERGRVASFFIGVVDVLAGLMALYDDFNGLLEPEEIMQLEQLWPKPTRDVEFVFTIRPDSTVLLDSEQRIQRLTRFLNITGKSGVVNLAPIIAEIAELIGLNPANVVVEPPPPAPEPVAISMRLSGAYDLMNPAAAASMLKAQQLPSPEELQAGFQFVKQVQDMMKQLGIAAPVDPNMPTSTEGALVNAVHNPPPAPAPLPPVAPVPEPEPGEQGPSEQQLDNYEAMPRVTKRPGEFGG